MLPFIIPGFIKVFEYWAIDFILAVRPDIDRKEAHRLSKDRVRRRWDLLCRPQIQSYTTLQYRKYLL